MSGICGFFERKNPTPAGEAGQCLQKMCQEMNHRGPHSLGIYAPGTGVGLAAVNLKVSNRAEIQQPLSNEDGSLWAALDGTIYNAPALRVQLEDLGHRFNSSCASEIILHAYEEWGADCVLHFDNAFAFAIWDGNRKHFFIARGRLGEKPLYYFFDGNRFIFASEIKSLLKHPASQSHIDPEALDMYMTFSYVPGPQTIYREIRKLPAGHVLTVGEKSELVCRQYWDVPLIRRSNPAPQIVENASREMLRLLESAVQARLLDDQPMGVFLSGGLDSSVITTLAKRYQSNGLKTFSVSFPDSDQDEAPFARAVAEHVGSEHHELPVKNCPPDLIRKLVWHCDEPLADPAIVPTYLVAKLASEHVSAVMTGDGPDQLLAGFFYYPLERKASGYDWMPAWAKSHLLVTAAQAANCILGRQRYHPRTLWSWRLHPQERVLAWMAIFTDEEKRRWFTPQARAIAAQKAPQRYLQSVLPVPDRVDWFANLNYFDMKIPLVDGLMMKVDKMSMAVSLDVRCPYLDHRFVEFAASLPESFKLRGENKYILRRVAEGLLPHEIVYRKKHGFDVPQRRWLSEDLKTYFWDLVSSRSFTDLGLITRPKVEEIWSEMEANVQSRTRQIWNILILAAWRDVVNP